MKGRKEHKLSGSMFVVGSVDVLDRQTGTLRAVCSTFVVGSVDVLDRQMGALRPVCSRQTHKDTTD